MIYSHTAMKTYLTCPRQFEARYILKTWPKFHHTPATRRGNEIHEHLEDAVNGKRQPPQAVWLPDNLIDKLRTAGARAEVEYTITRDGTPCDRWASDAWLTGKVDVELVSKATNQSVVIDWKTGKFYPDPLQADIYAVLQRAVHAPELGVTFSWVYVDARRTAQEKPDLFARKRVDAIVNQIETDEQMAPKPCFACRWCPLTNCEYNEAT